MNVVLVCPAPAGSRLGNRITAVRWRRLLADLGHRARVVSSLERVRRFDAVVALHARRSAAAVVRARACSPEAPIVVALTGTDLYCDLPGDRDALRSLELADSIVVLHALAWRAVPEKYRDKLVVVRQSAPRPAKRWRARRGGASFDVAVVGHLRDEKDPLRAAAASRLLPPSSRARVVHAGRALDEATHAAASQETRENPRYTWLGEVAPARARGLLAASDLFVLTSRVEGGANVLSEAIAAGAPIVSSRIDAAEALLGADHPGLFPVGDTRALARLMRRAEEDPAFLRDLAARSRARRTLVTEAAERTALARALLAARRAAARRVSFRD